ncbi:hypothetical protein M8818_004855 [Zalaria obscura]|uniref:Uncharacterized protein n=1 Tax=Zalaria obscura TaxID=2024903 RepID=A0ACC3SB83_9PEZI
MMPSVPFFILFVATAVAAPLLSWDASRPAHSETSCFYDLIGYLPCPTSDIDWVTFPTPITILTWEVNALPYVTPTTIEARAAQLIVPTISSVPSVFEDDESISTTNVTARAAQLIIPTINAESNVFEDDENSSTATATPSPAAPSVHPETFHDPTIPTLAPRILPKPHTACEARGKHVFLCPMNAPRDSVVAPGYAWIDVRADPRAEPLQMINPCEFGEEKAEREMEYRMKVWGEVETGVNCTSGVE